MTKKITLLVALLLALTIPPPVSGQANLKVELEAARLHYPTPMVALEQASLLNEVAWNHRSEGWGLERKDGGNNCPQPTTGIRVACDILRFGNQGMDVLRDAEGAGIPDWGMFGPADPNTFVKPVDPGSVQNPPDPTNPPSSNNATAELQRQQLTLLLNIVEKLDSQLKEQKAQSDALEAVIKDLKTEISKGVLIRFR